jgi:hypothetical protein
MALPGRLDAQVFPQKETAIISSIVKPTNLPVQVLPPMQRCSRSLQKKQATKQMRVVDLFPAVFLERSVRYRLTHSS